MTETAFRWGILGPGHVANNFAVAISNLPDAVVSAVASRATVRAKTFAEKHDIPRYYGSYEELARDPNIDAVYVATPHTSHCQYACLCMSHGKPVLVEKPFAVTAAEARLMIDTAQENNVFLMEAMWSRFFPLMSEIKSIIASGAIGEPRMLFAAFGFRAEFNAQGRLFNPDLAGGSLLDVGIYPLSFSSYIFGEPSLAFGTAEMGKTGVDEQAAIILNHPSGAISSLACAVRTNTPHEAVIVGSEGSITVAAPFWKPTKITIAAKDKRNKIINLPLSGNGFEFEAAEAANRIKNGELESPQLTLEESLSIMQTMDTIRLQIVMQFLGDRIKI